MSYPDTDKGFEDWKKSVDRLLDATLEYISEGDSRKKELALEIAKNSFLHGVNLGLKATSELLDDRLSQIDSSSEETPNSPSK